jgi:predicted nucleic acid-binding protein
MIDLFDDAVNDNIDLFMNIINWGEVYYIILREQGLAEADLFEENFDKLPVELVYPNKSLVKGASKYKAHNALSYADCIAAATADINNSALVTGNKEFEKLEREITIDWL